MTSDFIQIETVHLNRTTLREDFGTANRTQLPHAALQRSVFDCSVIKRPSGAEQSRDKSRDMLLRPMA